MLVKNKQRFWKMIPFIFFILPSCRAYLTGDMYLPPQEQMTVIPSEKSNITVKLKNRSPLGLSVIQKRDSLEQHLVIAPHQQTKIKISGGDQLQVVNDQQERLLMNLSYFMLFKNNAQTVRGKKNNLL